jgi:predicted Zn-dependent protease
MRHHRCVSFPLLRRGVAAAVALALTGGSVGLAAAQPAGAAQQLPSLGDPISDDFGPGQERRLGDQVMREIRRDPDYSEDPFLLEYLLSIWQPLVAQARTAGQIDADLNTRFAWEAFLVRDRSVNAFALPGGFVGVHLGLIGITATRDELASVLAHELTHVTQRHIARGLVNSRRQSMLATVGMLLGVIAAARANSGDAANAVIAGSQAAAIQGQLNFSRDMEREADRIGFAIATGAGFAPGGMAAMFEKLGQASRLNDNGAYPYLRSHPLTTDRVGEARARLGADPSAAPARPTAEHAVAQGRARALADTRVDSLRRWQAEDAERANASRAERLAAAAGSAVASTLLRDWARADAALRQAQALVREGGGDRRGDRALAIIAAESFAARGDGAAALAALAPFASDGSRPVMLLAARAAVGAGAAPEAARRAADDLQTWVALHPGDAPAWQALAQVWTKLNQPLRALRGEAEARVALGDLGGAIERLRAGQRLARSGGAAVDHIDASVIDARLREVEGQRRAQLLDDRQGPP